jgi:hypothetical protein
MLYFFKLYVNSLDLNDKIKIPDTITCEEIRFCVLGDIGCQLGGIPFDHISFPVNLTSLQTYFHFMHASNGFTNSPF